MRKVHPSRAFAVLAACFPCTLLLSPPGPTRLFLPLPPALRFSRSLHHPLSPKPQPKEQPSVESRPSPADVLAAGARARETHAHGCRETRAWPCCDSNDRCWRDDIAWKDQRECKDDKSEGREVERVRERLGEGLTEERQGSRRNRPTACALIIFTIGTATFAGIVKPKTLRGVSGLGVYALFATPCRLKRAFVDVTRRGDVCGMASRSKSCEAFFVVQMLRSARVSWIAASRELSFAGVCIQRLSHSALVVLDTAPTFRIPGRGSSHESV